jgi:hypothetical protein
VALISQPIGEARGIGIEVDACDADLLKAERAAFRFNAFDELLHEHVLPG